MEGRKLNLFSLYEDAKVKGRKLKLFSQYEAVVEYNAEEETKSYNVHRKTGDYIIGEVGSNKNRDFQNI